MSDGIFRTPEAYNEPVRQYAPGSDEKASLKAAYQRLGSETIEIPVRIGGEKVNTGRLADVVQPHDHAKVLARFHKGLPGQALGQLVEVRKLEQPASA